MTLDLRLAPAVAVAWAAAWWLVGPGAGSMASGVVVGGVGGLVVAAGLLASSQRPAVAHAVLALACAIAVALSVHVQAAARAPLEALAAEGATAGLVGRVASEPEPDAFGGGVRWVLAVDTLEARGATTRSPAHVEVTGPPPGPRYGARVRVTARLRSGEPGAGEAARATADEPASETRPPSAFLAGTHAMRAALLDVTDDLSAQARGLVPGAAVGDTSRLPDDLDGAMRVTGLTHITAVSGGHFAVVIATLTALGAMLRLPRVARVAVLVVASIAFVLLVRPEPSVLRAAWTCAVALLGLALGRPSTGFAALATAATALLVVDPWLARSYGFVLSCAATAGLVLIAGPFARRLAPWTGAPAGLALAVPVAAQAACGPVLVLLEPSLPMTSVLANLLAAPALVPATVLGLAATLLAPWTPGVAYAVAWLAGLATGWITLVARWCAGLPLATLPWPGGAGGALLLGGLTGALLVVVLRRPAGPGWPHTWREAGPRTARAARRAVRRRRRWPLMLTLALCAGCLAVVVAVPRLVPAGDRVPADWEIVACDVGQGDALAVRTGPASAVVIDAGPPGSAAGRCLDRLGVERIELLVISHFHADHAGGLDGVLAGRSVDAALVSALDQPSDQAEHARGLLADAGVPVRVAATGDSGTAGTTSWRVLGADASGDGGGRAGEEGGDGANGASVALALRTAHGVDLVALGDLEEQGQETLLAGLRDAGVAGQVDVVKMAHHGSRSQSAALAALLSPRVALVSVGSDNTYGHPTDQALDLYAGLGAALVRTDECGTSALVVRDGSLAVACS